MLSQAWHPSGRIHELDCDTCMFVIWHQSHCVVLDPGRHRNGSAFPHMRWPRSAGTGLFEKHLQYVQQTVEPLALTQYSSFSLLLTLCWVRRLLILLFLPVDECLGKLATPLNTIQTAVTKPPEAEANIHHASILCIVGQRYMDVISVFISCSMFFLM